MLALRWLNAPDRPQLFPLSPGTLVLGRGSDCQIRIQSQGISKRHMQLQVTADKIVIQDLGSTNGTFVNGIKVQHQVVRPGDKIMLHNYLFDLIEMRKNPSQPRPHEFQQQAHWPPAHAPAAPMPPPPTPMMSETSVQSFLLKVTHYFDDVAMPGLYKLADMFEFRLVLATMVGIFIIMVTTLASIPMASLSRHSMQVESMRRALTLARYVEARNHEAIAQGVDSALDVSLPHEEGMKAALIVAHTDGHIMAPASKAGRYEDMPFIAESRHKDVELTQVIDASTIGASVPIRFFNAEQGAQVTGAHVIVLYDASSLASEGGLLLSLFIQVFFIAALLGSLLFIIMYRLIENPIRQLNQQLDEALRDGEKTVSLEMQFPALELLCSNINSALSRVGQGGSHDSDSGANFLATDIENLVQMVSTPCLAVRGSDDTILALNNPFAQLTDVAQATAFNQPLDVIVDQAMRLNIQDLIAKCRQSGAVESDQLELVSGQKLNLTCKAITIGRNIGFYLIIMQSAEGELAA